jgi:hypothetical protein
MWTDQGEDHILLLRVASTTATRTIPLYASECALGHYVQEDTIRYPVRDIDLDHIAMHLQTIRGQRDAIREFADEIGVDLQMVRSLEQWLVWAAVELEELGE